MRKFNRDILLPSLLLIISIRIFAAASGPAKQTVLVPMRDGVKLATDVHLPNAQGMYPVILLRTPYNKNNVGKLPVDACNKGYALVVQDTRGRFGSEGQNLPFIGDGWSDGKLDGFDTAEWISKQAWCNGKIGTAGGSALGITQFGMAGAQAPHLVCQHIVVGTPGMYHDAIYTGGVFKKSMIEDWLRATNHSPDSLKIWVMHPRYDEFWKARDLRYRWKNVNVPAVHIGGWYDIFTQGTIDGFLGYQLRGGEGARGRQKLVMGPWTHAVGNRKAGELEYPANASNPPSHINDMWRWFDYWLKDMQTGIEKDAPVTYYVMGDPTDSKAPGNEWRTSDVWPVPATSTQFFFRKDRSLSMDREKDAHSVVYAYDPKDPCPTIGGPQLTLPGGPFDQQKIESRADVITFTTDSLKAPLEITGRIRAKLMVSSDAPDTDFVVKLCDVYPDGRSLNVCEGILRARFRNGFEKEVMMQPDRIYPLDIDLWSTSIVFNCGHRIRVIVTSSSVPGYDANPNTGDPFRSSDRTQIAHNTIHIGGRNASRVILPVVTGK